MADTPPPHITLELIEYLEGLYPDRVPDPAVTDREVWCSVGSVRVIRKLKQLRRDQSTNVFHGGA